MLAIARDILYAGLVPQYRIEDYSKKHHNISVDDIEVRSMDERAAADLGEEVPQ